MFESLILIEIFNATRNINRAFEEKTFNERTVQRWFRKFYSGDFSLQNEPRGRPKASIHNNILRTLVEEDPRQRNDKKTC